jgi:hypothetical protein
MKSKIHRSTSQQSPSSRISVEDTFVFASHTTYDKDDSSTTTHTKVIRLMMLSCEDSAPYGPSKHTAVSEISYDPIYKPGTYLHAGAFIIRYQKENFVRKSNK